MLRGFLMDDLMDAERDLQYQQDSGDDLTNILFSPGAQLLIFIIYVVGFAYMVKQMQKQDEPLRPKDKVFQGCCAVGFFLVCCFTPFCFGIMYYSVTLRKIEDKKAMVRARTAQQVPVAVSADPDDKT